MAEIHRPIPGWTPSTPAVKASSLPHVLDENALVVVHFWAEWNGYDPVLDRAIQSLPQQAIQGIYFCSSNVDVPENADLCRACNVLNIPALGCFIYGEFHRCAIGCHDSDKLQVLLEEWREAALASNDPS
jgi:hypothetical protein